MKKILCLAMCAVFAAALPARAPSDEYRDAVAEMMELTGALRNADVVVTQMFGYLKTSAPPVSEAVWEKIISKFNEKMRPHGRYLCADLFQIPDARRSA